MCSSDLFSPYGSNWGDYFGSGNYLTLANSTNLYLSSDFTIEMWINPSESLGNPGAALLQYRNNTSWGTGDFQLWARDNGIFWDVPTGGSNQITVTNAYSAGNWTHIAITRQSGTIRAYINGVFKASVSDSTTFNGNGGTKRIANIYDGSNYYFNGYISNLRINNTTALYTGTGSFTPSTTPLTAVSGTQLLSCQSNRFVDNSSNNAAITVGDRKSTRLNSSH